MKVAVSVPDDVFRQADEQASRLGLKRSQLYARALEEFLARHEVDPVTQRLNELAEHMDPAVGSASARRLIDSGGWEW